MKNNNLKPKDFDELICKDIIFPKDSVVMKMIENNDLFSILFFGNPGVGKSLAIEYILKKLNKKYYYFNSTTHNKNDLDSILEKAKNNEKPIIVIEEIHRLNKDKQDLLLMFLEKQMIIVFASTTENPYFKVNPAIRSRMFLYKIENINPIILSNEFIKYLESKSISVPNRVVETIVEYSKSDFRQITFYLDIVLKYYPNYNENTILEQLFKIHVSNIDRKATNHYDLLSAFHKSIRGSNPDAALYYLGQLLTTNDLISIYRRLYAVVYEDIGLANSNLGPKVHAAIQASEALGMPESRIPLSAIVVELCLSPKSNSTFLAMEDVFKELNKNSYSPPHHIRDNHYKSAINLGVKDYLFPHNYNFSYVDQQYLPNEIKNKKFFKPKQYSLNEMKYIKYWNEVKNKK